MYKGFNDRIANAFGSTFAFFANAKAKQKNTKELPSQRTTTDTMAGQQHDRKNNEHLTAPTKNWRFSASYDSFVVNQTFVLRMNICGKNRQLLVAAKRYLPF